VQIQYLDPGNPAYYSNLVNCAVWIPQVDGAISYSGQSTVAGTAQSPAGIDQSFIPDQEGYVPGYWRFNVGPFTAGEAVTIWGQACNANGCSVNGPVLSIPNAQPGNYGSPPTGIPTAAPSESPTVSVVSASISDMTISVSAVTGADSFEIIDTDNGYDIGNVGSGTGGTITFQIPASLLQSLGYAAGNTINLAAQACNIIGCGPTGQPTAITLTS
jgi:hypothetical protein